jgi:P-type conjugative transfer protein TrbJ
LTLLRVVRSFATGAEVQMVKRRIGALALLLLLLLPAPGTHAQTLVYDGAVHYQEILQLIQQVLAYYQRYRDYVEQVEQGVRIYRQLQAALKNLEDIENLSSREIATTLHALQEVIGEIDAVIYIRDDVNRQFRELYAIEPVNDVRDAERERIEKTLESLGATLLATHRMARISVRSQKDLGAAKKQLDEAEGNLQAIQAAGIISSHAAEEVSRAVELQAASNNALAVAFAERLSRELTAAESFHRWLERGAVAPRRYGAYEPISTLPAGFP